MAEQSPTPDRRAPLVAIVLVAIGAVFLIGEIFNVRFGSGFWPFVIIVPGVMLLASAFSRGGRVNSGAATGGAVLTTLGLILWYQNISGNWESWTYIWALLPLSAGVAQMVAGGRTEDESLAAGGRQTARTSAIMFAVGIIFFELIIFDRGGFGGYFLPLALIAAGGYMLWRHNSRGGSMPWGDMFRGPEPSAPASTAASTPPPAAASAQQSAIATPPPSNVPFPEDELPHHPTPDDAPFPTDEQSPEVPTEGASASAGDSDQPQADAQPTQTRKPAPRRRSSTTRKSTTTRKRPPSEG
ncbi:MAG: LiaF transmembrane domain-containing protein [Alphaproteobacteria bacterium]